MICQIDRNKYRLKVVQLLDQKCGEYNDFCISKKPSIKIESYIDRMFTYAKCSEEALIISLIYLKRINPNLINEYSIHQLFLCSTIIAIKYVDDNHYNNGYYARVGGVDKDQLSKLELLYLNEVDFNLFVSDQEFIEFFNHIKIINV